MAESPSDAVALTLRELREGTGETQAQLAQRLGWPHSRYSKIESAAQQWTIVDLWQVSEAFGLTPSELVRRAARKLRDTGRRGTGAR